MAAPEGAARPCPGGWDCKPQPESPPQRAVAAARKGRAAGGKARDSCSILSAGGGSTECKCWLPTRCARWCRERVFACADSVRACLPALARAFQGGCDARLVCCLVCLFRGAAGCCAALRQRVFARHALAMPSIALARLLCLRCGPGGPAGGAAAGGVQRDAVHGAHGQAQFTPGAVAFDDGVHHLAGADDGVGGADLQAQRAADAPVLIDECHRARPLAPMPGIQRQRCLAGDRGQARHPLGPAGRALVDRRRALGNGLRIGAAVGIAAARALRLGQRGVDPRRQIGQGAGGWRLAQALRALLRGAGVAAALAALRAVPGPAGSAATAATALAGSGDTPRVAIAGAAGVLAAARGAEVVGGTASTVCAVCCAGSLPALLAGVTGTATGASAAAVVAATTAGASAFFGGDGCARMKSRTWGYTMSRQRRPLKMP